MIGYAVSYEPLKSQETWVVELTKESCLFNMRVFYREHVQITHSFLVSVLSLGSLAEKMEQNVCASAVMRGGKNRRRQRGSPSKGELKSSSPGCGAAPSQLKDSFSRLWEF